MLFQTLCGGQSLEKVGFDVSAEVGYPIVALYALFYPLLFFEIHDVHKLVANRATVDAFKVFNNLAEWRFVFAYEK
jgi:hypothetical protein